MKRMKQELKVLRNKPIHVQIVKDSRKVSRLRIEKSFNKFTVDALSQDYIQFQVLNEFIEYIRPYINISVVDDNYMENAVKYRAELDILV
jgi:hypothetical protein